MWKKYVLVPMTLFLFMSLECGAVEVTAVKTYSYSDRTLVVIQLDGHAQYRMKFCPQRNVGLSLLKTRISSIGDAININDKFVKTVNIKEVAGGETSVEISLAKPSLSFTVFPLESPYRIIIDIEPSELYPTLSKGNVKKGRDVGASQQAISPFGDRSQVADSLPSGSGQVEESSVNMGLFPLLYSKFQNIDHMLVQFCFDSFIVFALVVMGIKLRRGRTPGGKGKLCKGIRSMLGNKSLKKEKAFNDIIDELSKNPQEEVEKHRTFSSASDGPACKRKKILEPDIEPKLLPKQYDKVYELAKRGMDRLSISQRSNVPIGEVNLILDLSKRRAWDKLGV